MPDRDELRRRAVVASLMSATWLAAMEAGDEPFLDVIFAGVSEPEQTERIAKAAQFLALAGSNSGEVMFRWMHAAGHHQIPVEAWARWPRLHPVRLWFELVAALLCALRPVLEGPPAPSHETVVPPSQPNADNVYTERVGQQFERSFDRGLTTEKVIVSFPKGAPAQTVGEMFAAEGRRMPRAAKEPPRDDVMPTASEMAAMPVEERRRFIGLDPRFGAEPAISTQAPPIDDYERETVTTLHGKAQVSIPRTAGSRPPNELTVEAGAGPSGQGPALQVSSEGAGDDVPAGDGQLPHIHASALQGGDAERYGSASPLPSSPKRKGKAHDDEA